MRTEYMLTDAQKARVRQINEQLTELYKELGSIYAMARIACIIENPEEGDASLLTDMYRYATFGEPIIKQDAIGKLNFGGDDDDDRRAEETGGGEP